MAVEVDLRSARTREVVNWYVRHRTGQLDGRQEAQSLFNGHVRPATVVRNRHVVDSVNGSEDDIDGPSSYHVEPAFQRRITAPRGAAAAVINGHVNGDVPYGIGDELPPELQRVINALTNEFEQRYQEAFHSVYNEFFLTPDNAHGIFMQSVNSLFSDGVVSWGRIIALLAFSGAVAAECVEKEMPYVVNQIVSWTTTYIDQRLASWIQENGGWNGLIAFYSNAPSQNGPSWPTLKTLCGCAVGALGFLTLGALLTQK